MMGFTFNSLFLLLSIYNPIREADASVFSLPNDLMENQIFQHVTNKDIVMIGGIHPKWHMLAKEHFGISKVEEIVELVKDINNETFPFYYTKIEDLLLNQQITDQILVALFKNDKLSQFDACDKILTLISNHSKLSKEQITTKFITDMKDLRISKSAKCKIIARHISELYEHHTYYLNSRQFLMNWMVLNGCHQSEFHRIWMGAATYGYDIIETELLPKQIPIGKSLYQKRMLVKTLIFYLLAIRDEEEFIKCSDVFINDILDRLIIDCSHHQRDEIIHMILFYILDWRRSIHSIRRIYMINGIVDSTNTNIAWLIKAADDNYDTKLCAWARLKQRETQNAYTGLSCCCVQ